MSPALLGALTVAIGVCYWDVFRGLVHQWATDDNYSHGFLILPFALYVLWQRRHQLAAERVQPRAWGALLVVMAAGMLAAGVAAAELFLARASLVPLLAGSVAFVWGRGHLRLARFPIVLLVLAIPLPAILFNQIAFPLQLFASQVGEVTLRAADVPVLRDGNILELETMRLEVAEACSGIRSLISLLAFAVVVGHLGGCSTRRRWLLAAATIPVAVAANAARVAATGLAAHLWGTAAAEGTLHSASGMVVFCVAVAALLAINRVHRPVWMAR